MSRTSSRTRAARHYLPTRSRTRLRRRPPSPAQDTITCVISIDLSVGIEAVSRVAHVSRRIHPGIPGYAVPTGRRLDAAADRPKTSRRLRRRLEAVETAVFTVVRTFNPDDRTSLYDQLDTADHGETTGVTTQIEAITAVETAGARPLPGARAGGVDGCGIMR